MLFDFDHPKVLSFWMKNTYIPLDIAFIKEDGTVAKTAKMVPLSMKSVSSEEPCVMALEVAAGTLDRLGVETGSKVKIDWEKKVLSFDDNP